MNIVLVGFMGTGKTAVSKLLAKETGMKYISTDELIEDKERRPINEIFKKSGEAYFRRAEKEMVKKVAQLNNFVIDAGGGIVLDKENVENLKRNGKIVCLFATPEAILERTKRYHHRPLLNIENPKAKVEELLEFRAPFYAQADFSIDTTNLSVEQATQEIKKIINENLSQGE